VTKPTVGLTVGFDLDMTLIDTRQAMAAVYDALVAETGAPIDSAVAAGRLGPPLDEELALWVPEDKVAALADRFRALYPEHAIEAATLLPGAREAIDAVRRHGGQVLVVTGKYEPNARLHLEHLHIEVDEVVGWVWGAAKGPVLVEHGATIYVGDHVLDVAGAHAAGALSVAVTTGAVDTTALREAGADAVLDDLTAFPAWLDEHVLSTRLAALDQQLRGLSGVLVAFSGGTDSAFLLAAAVRALGPERVAAATAISPSLPAAEREAASAFAATLGVRHLRPATDELSREGYRANAGDRCYFCKAELLDVLTPLAAELGLATVATGTNADDAIAGFRPGIRAAAERGARTPLRDAGLTKAQVREASRRWGLRTWNKPAAACLSSRVAYGLPITSDRLARIERAEVAAREAIERAGHVVRNIRVRDLGGPDGRGHLARLEVDSELAPAVAADQTVIDAVRRAGFDGIEIDPQGFRSGSMNELLPDPERYR
jgi:uncharacterized protein